MMAAIVSPIFKSDGAQHFPLIVRDSLAEIFSAIDHLPLNRAGSRISGNLVLRPLLLPTGKIGRIAALVLGSNCHAVRAIFFDKSQTQNWALGWHQDRTICVKQRIEVDGFGSWTIKSGLNHVEPPVNILEKIVTLRLHLDDVPSYNAPLLFAPGSHQFGRITEGDIDSIVRQCGTQPSIAQAGDIWLYSSLILHASERALLPAHRRVLQIDFATGALPSGLEWLGI
jgi:ectoine hydroxylase-related dioxygenase (phytanoyl-CoA dioxygenase family)